MKKYLIAIILLSSLTIAKAQNAIIFKIKYLPGHTYQINNEANFSLNSDLSGNKEIVSKLEAQGITQPMHADIKYASSGTVTTGTIGPDNNFRLTMKFNAPDVSGTVNNKPIPMPPVKPSDKLFYGHISPDGKLNQDSLTGQKLNDSLSQQMRKMMNNFIKNINFPDHALKVGDSFTQDVPFNMPMVGNDVDVSIKIIYKLISVADGMAYFDLSESMDIKLNIKAINVTVTGKGMGKMTYDIKNSFPSKTDSNVNLFITVKSDKFNAAGTAKIATTNAYTIN